MHDNLFVSNKLRNKVVSNICRDFIYLRNYYQKDNLRFFDCSNTHSIKIDLENSMRIYLNNDNQNADIVTFGPGLLKNLSFFEIIIEILKK